MTADVPPYAVVAGSPAKVRSYRFDHATIDRLLASQWWTLPIDEIWELPLTDVEATLSYLERKQQK